MNQRHLQTVYENEEDRQLARILSTLIWATAGMYLVATFNGLYYNDWKLIAVTLTGCALLSAAMLLLRRGHLRASSLIVVLGALGTTTMLATVGQGIRDLALAAIPIVFIFAGLTLNRAFFRLCVGLALAAVCWLALGEIYGWFVPIPFDGEMSNWLYLISTIVLLLVAALSVDLLAINMRKSLELARREIAQRKQMETNNRIIAEVQDTLLHPCELKDIYRLVAEKVKELIGDGIVATSILDEKNKTLRMGSYHGVDIQFEKVLSVIGFDPWQKEFPLDAMAEEDLSIYYNNKLGILEGGLYALMTRVVPKSACLMIEKLLRVQKIYGMGFIHKQAHLGGLVILARGDITPHIAAIEQIVNLATIAIERKRAEDEVKNSEMRFQALIAQGRDNISMLSADGTLLWESPSVNSVLGYAPNQLVGENIFKLIHPDDQAWTSNLYAQIVQSPGSIQDGELRLLHADGAWRWIECSAANLLNEPSVQAIVLNYRDITERKHAEEKFTKAFQASPTIVTISRLSDGRLIDVNESFEKIIGYTRAEAFGHTIFELGLWVNLAEREHLLPILLANGTLRNEEVHFRNKRGEVITCMYSAELIELNGEKCALAVIEDITERKKMEVEIRQSEEKFSKSIDAVSDMFVISRVRDEQYVYANRAFEMYTGLTQNEIVGKTSLEINIWKDVSDRERMTKEFKSQGFIKDFHFALQRKSGEQSIASMSASAIELNGELHIVSIVRDISESKRMEEALKESDELLRSIFVSTIDSITVTDIGGRIILCNQAATIIHGYSSTEQLIGKSLFELVAEEDRQRAEENMKQIMMYGFLKDVQFTGLKHSGEKFAGELTVSLLKDNLGRSSGFVGITKDITERKQAEEKIRAALEEKETLLREVHHRVKNNLQVIISLIKMRARLTQDAGTLQFLIELESQAHTMSLVYEQLYQSENLAQVNMAQYLRQLTANVLDTYGRRDAIQFHLEASLALDVAQAMPCGLIVNELFSNILKHAFPPGFKGKPSVSITLRQEDETYHLTVSDNGVGFPPGYDWSAGQTMGLRLVNLWVTHQMGGTLTVSGKPGTTFAIAFDLKN